MKIDQDILARVYSFDLQFKGGKRTQFYRKLFGFKSKSTREDKNGREKTYETFYPGLLTPIPHMRLGKSVIAVPKTAREEVDAFFEDSRWGSIDLYSFDGILPSDDRRKAMEETLERIKSPQNETLRSEIESLKRLESKNQLDSQDSRRVRGVLNKVESLLRHDWTDDSEFTKDLRQDIEVLNDYV